MNAKCNKFFSYFLKRVYEEDVSKDETSEEQEKPAEPEKVFRFVTLL